jgi:hypothetical protein
MTPETARKTNDPSDSEQSGFVDKTSMVPYIERSINISWSEDRSFAASLMVGLRVTIGLILIVISGTLTVRAQVPCTDPALRRTRNCPAPSGQTNSYNDVTGISNRTNAALACEWIDYDPANADNDGASHTLIVFQSLTSGAGRVNDINKEARAELVANDPVDDDSLYAAAMGLPDETGQPTVDPPVNLTNAIATANLLPKPQAVNKKAYEAKLTACTKVLINRLAATPDGEMAIVQINSEFQRVLDDNAKYRGLSQLLSAYASCKQCNATPGDYVNDLEKFRTLFALDGSELASEVSAEVVSTQ